MSSIINLEARYADQSRKFDDIQCDCALTLESSTIYNTDMNVVTYINNLEMNYLGVLEGYVNSASAYCVKYNFKNSVNLLDALVELIHNIRNIFENLRKNIETSYPEVYNELNTTFHQAEILFNYYHPNASDYIEKAKNYDELFNNINNSAYHDKFKTTYKTERDENIKKADNDLNHCDTALDNMQEQIDAGLKRAS